MHLIFLLSLFLQALAIPQSGKTCYCFCKDGAYAGSTFYSASCSEPAACFFYSSSCTAFGNGAPVSGSSIPPSANAPVMGSKSTGGTTTTTTTTAAAFEFSGPQMIFNIGRGIGGLVVFAYCCYYYYVQKPKQKAALAAAQQLKI
ncbi:hypothetical protein BC833DRAFT_565319 [Globomyces pollinis-pini]|nr:hypothetical protein BC833DRAFT_565319 [Globomyces pollinis-pini]